MVHTYTWNSCTLSTCMCTKHLWCSNTHSLPTWSRWAYGYDWVVGSIMGITWELLPVIDSSSYAPTLWPVVNVTTSRHLGQKCVWGECMFWLEIDPSQFWITVITVGTYLLYTQLKERVKMFEYYYGHKAVSEISTSSDDKNLTEYVMQHSWHFD